MLYFQFNTEKFNPPQKTYSVTPYKNGSPISESYNETVLLSFGEVSRRFFGKVYTELNLNIYMNHALYDVLDIPMGAFCVDNECTPKSDCEIQFELSEYTKLPIEELGNKSLQDLGIKIEFCKKIANNESERLLNQYMQQNGLSYITEEVLQKGLNNAEKANTFSEFFSEIFSVGKELIIIDPYLFKDDSDEYCDLLADLLNKAAAHSIIVITNQKNYKQSSYNKTSGKVNNTIEIKYSNDFHDRFWISDRKKGFSTGTSLNGIGNKISSINLLPENDVTEIIKLLCLQSLI